jgi:polyhydroxybutyrate depolymerase
MNRRFPFRVGLILAVVIAAAALFLILLAAYARAVYTPPAGEISGRIDSGGETRAYVLHVPPSYDPSAPVPLVISLHGFAEWPAHQMEISRWNDLADRFRFLVVYPAGTGFPPRWRIRGSETGSTVPMIDAEFISNLIDTLAGQYAIDPARVYANGLSNGGGMSDMLACTLSDRIAAVGGSVSFHEAFPPVTVWAADWAARNGCGDAPAELPPTGEVTGIRYGECRDGAEVILYTIHGGGHAWPGSRPLPEWLVGRTTQDIDATAVMWEFFLRHPIPSN